MSEGLKLAAINPKESLKTFGMFLLVVEVVLILLFALFVRY